MSMTEIFSDSWSCYRWPLQGCSKGIGVMRNDFAWWLHQMETFSALLAICVGNSPVTGEFPTQRPVTRSFDVFFDLRPNQHLRFIRIKPQQNRTKNCLCQWLFRCSGIVFLFINLNESIHHLYLYHVILHWLKIDPVTSVEMFNHSPLSPW